MGNPVIQKVQNYRKTYIINLVSTNDVVDLFTDGSCIKLYADDVKLYLEIENDSDVAMLQQSVDKFVKWTQTWQLSLSSQKCCHIYALVYSQRKTQLIIILMMLFLTLSIKCVIWV